MPARCGRRRDSRLDRCHTRHTDDDLEAAAATSPFFNDVFEVVEEPRAEDLAGVASVHAAPLIIASV